MKTSSRPASRAREGLCLSLIAADPQSTTEDYLDEEANVIRESFADSARDPEITPIIATSEEDLLQHISRARPHVLHFTGHGTPLAKVLLRTADGPFRRKTAKSLARLVRTADLVPECVVLNNC